MQKSLVKYKTYYKLYITNQKAHTAQKMKFFINDFFSKCDQIHRCFSFLPGPRRRISFDQFQNYE